MRLIGQDPGKTGLEVGIGEIKGTQDRNAHPLLALKVGAVMRHVPLEDEHRACAGFNRIPATDIGLGVVARPKPLADIGRVTDALTLVGQPEHEGSTRFEADRAGYQRIDHVFVSGDLVGSVTHAWIDTPAKGSDHQPVFAELSFL
ncbi:MAG: hypothetical protein WCO04_03240 [Pseudomonadota bacterium]